MSAEQATVSECRYCVAAWGKIGRDCRDHLDERTVSVARQLAQMVHRAEPTDEQIGWFIEDAETIAAVVKDDVLTVTNWNQRTLRFKVGEVRFHVDDENGGLHR